MNKEKLMKMASAVRTGGKGSVRRKKKAVHKTTTTDDKRLQSTLKRLGVNTIPGIEEVNIFLDETVIHFVNPKGIAAVLKSLDVIHFMSKCLFLHSLLHKVQILKCKSGEILYFISKCRLRSLSDASVQASIAANTWVVSGPSQTKKLQELLPGIINQLGLDNLMNLKKIAQQFQRQESGGAQDEDDDDVPDLVEGENFEEASKQEVAV